MVTWVACYRSAWFNNENRISFGSRLRDLKLNVAIFRNFFMTRTRSSNSRNSNQVPKRHLTIFLPEHPLSNKINRPFLPTLVVEKVCPKQNNLGSALCLSSAAFGLRCVKVMIHGARGTSVIEEEQRRSHTINCVWPVAI